MIVSSLLICILFSLTFCFRLTKDGRVQNVEFKRQRCRQFLDKKELNRFSTTSFVIIDEEKIIGNKKKSSSLALYGHIL